MPWNFEKVVGPFGGATMGLAWDGSGMLFCAVDEGRILRFDSETGTVEEFRKYTQRTSGIAWGPDNILFGSRKRGAALSPSCPTDRRGRRLTSSTAIFTISLLI